MLDKETWINLGGLTAIFLVVYGQTGLFFCFFLPSGGFLFMAGLLIANGLFDHHLFVLIITGILAAVLGNSTGYWIGVKSEKLLLRQQDSWFFKQQYLQSAKKFYQKYGYIALSIGIFFPIIRTFGPLIAGIIQTKFSQFFAATLLSATIWVNSFVLAGYLLGQLPVLQSYMNYFIMGVLMLTVLIIILKAFFKRTGALQH